MGEVDVKATLILIPPPVLSGSGLRVFLSRLKPKASVVQHPDKIGLV
jgi:hypothetical protein